MNSLHLSRCAVIVCAAMAAAACNGSSAPPPLSRPPPLHSIQHVVILLQENRSFNNLFMGFPGADTATSGKCNGLSRGAQPGGRGWKEPISRRTTTSYGVFRLK